MGKKSINLFVRHSGEISNQIYEDLKELYKLKEIIKVSWNNDIIITPLEE